MLYLYIEVTSVCICTIPHKAFVHFTRVAYITIILGRSNLANLLRRFPRQATIGPYPLCTYKTFSNWLRNLQSKVRLPASSLYINTSKLQYNQRNSSKTISIKVNVETSFYNNLINHSSFFKVF